VLLAAFCSFALYLTISYRERLAIQSELQTLGIDGVGFGSGNEVTSIWAHGPIQDQFAQKYKRLEIADFKESTSSLKNIEVLAKMDEVKTLILSLSNVSNAEIATLKNVSGLKHLWLSNTRVTDACIDHLAEIQELETIKLNGTAITPQGIQRLHSMKPNLKIQ
jgi:hypothetical protein